MTDPQTLIETYLAGELAQAEHADLARWLSADESNRQLFLAEVDFYRTVRGVLVQEQSELARHIEADNTDVATPIDEPLPPIHIDAEKLTKKQVVSALSYVIHHTFTPKRIATLATAAALLLGVVLAIVMLTGPDDNEPIAEQPPTTNDRPTPLPQTTAPVATLTNTHNAQWAHTPAEGASAPGSLKSLTPGTQLHPNQRLTLTAGFAEITTNDSAIAILQAPATVELLDHNNAIRLHAGKLVGICETESSKGLLVRTPHMDITDLGTRFGVDISDAETAVHVLVGAVEIAPTERLAHSPDRRVLLAGEALIGSQEQGIQSISADPQAFDFDISDDAIRPRITGDAWVWFGAPPRDLRMNRHEFAGLQVFLEHQSLDLKQDTIVDVLPGQDWNQDTIVGEARVSSGRKVDVYLLHLDSIGEQMLEGSYRIEFDRPILGVIGAESTLRQTDAQLGNQAVAYPSRPEPDSAVGGRSGLDLWPSSDTASISPDGKTLTLKISGDLYTDQVRILVQSAPTTPAGPREDFPDLITPIDSGRS